MFKMKDDDSVFPNKDYHRVNWCNANSDIIDAPMEKTNRLGPNSKKS